MSPVVEQRGGVLEFELVNESVLRLQTAVCWPRLGHLLHQLAHNLPAIVYHYQQRARVEQFDATVWTLQHVCTSETRSTRINGTHDTEVQLEEQLEQRAGRKVHVENSVRAVVELQRTFPDNVLALDVAGFLVAVQSE